MTGEKRERVGVAESEIKRCTMPNLNLCINSKPYGSHCFVKYLHVIENVVVGAIKLFLHVIINNCSGRSRAH
jgi:hypothetical protein